MIDIWAKPISSNNSLLSTLNLNKLNFIDPVDLSLIPKDKIKWIRLITIVNSQDDCDQVLLDAKKHDVNRIIFISTYDVFKNIYCENLKIDYFVYINSEFNIFNTKLDNVFYFTDDEQLYNQKLWIDYFWPNFHYNEQSFNSLKISCDRKIEVVPFSVYNPDSETGINFNPVGNCLFKIKKKECDISIIIPHYDNFDNLKCVLKNLEVAISQVNYDIEIILVDDGSLDEDDIEEIKSNFSLTFIQLSRKYNRIMGDCAYRAGVARNFGALYATGKILVFQDCDILISSSFLSCLLDLHQKYNLIMPKRIQLNNGILKRHSEIRNTDLSINQNPYWAEFYNNTIIWNERAASWKYVSSYCLSIECQLFFEIGGFSSSFVGYGCEDVDLGYRLYSTNKKFHLSEMEVFHMQPPLERSEYNHDPSTRQNLLKRAYYYLYKRSYSEEVFNELILGKQK